MNILTSLILGLIEGLTEFLPISSTFHLIYTSRLLGLLDTPFLKLFEVFIQAGAISALLFIYLGTLLKNPRLTRFVFISFLPTALVGTILYRVIKDVFFGNDPLMLTVFVLMALLFFFLERLVKTGALKLTKSLKNLNSKEALLVGLAQSLAVIPGVSRAGSVISGMMGLGYTRVASTKYTFLLSLPTILAASFYDLYQSRALLLSGGQEPLLLFFGFSSAFIVAYFSVNWFVNYVKSHSLNLFAWYRLGIALVLLLYLYA